MRKAYVALTEKRKRVGVCRCITAELSRVFYCFALCGALFFLFFWFSLHILLQTRLPQSSKATLWNADATQVL